MNRPSRRDRLEEVAAENDLLLEEVHVARRAADITARVVIEQFTAMEGIQQQLETVIEAERVARASHQEAKAAAEAANRAKSDFLANMSHEIRTPMNAILGMADLALGLEMPPKLRNYFEVIRTSGYSLLAIINEILDFSKIEAGRLELEAVDLDLRSVLDAVADLFAERAAAKGIELLVSADRDVPLALVGDPLRLGQVLTNLVGNAIKFTGEGEVSVRVEAAGEVGERVRLRFTVADQGIGMTEEQIGRLFSAFSQADASTTRKYGGTGLGLAISKRLVEGMGGRIWVESEAGRGSRFRFEIDLGVRVAGEPAVRPPEDVRGLTVLVVDDSDACRIVFREMLESLAFRVEESASGRDALERIEAARTAGEPVPLVLMDWRMPGEDGIEIAARIRAQPEHAGTKVILATAFGRQEEMLRAQEAGIDAFLVKPIKPSLLFDTILEVLGRQPVRPSGAPRPSAGPAEAARLAGVRVLLVEDNPINQQIATEVLRRAGVEVEVAGDGHEALEAAGRGGHDAILMDVQMPGMDGYEATARLRADPATAGVPVIAMTAHAMKGDRERCLAAGMDDYVTKPIDAAELYRTVARWVGHREPGAPAAPEPPPGPVEESADLPGIDVAAGLTRLGGNRDLYRRLLSDFARDAATGPDRIRAAQGRGDAEEALRTAHSIKGVAGNLALPALQREAGIVERALRAGETCDLTGLEAALAEALDSIARLDAPAQAPAPAPASRPTPGVPAIAVGPALTDLARRLESFDLSAGDVLATLAADLAGVAPDACARLREQIDGLDYPAAIETLTDLSRSLGLSIR